VVDVQARRNRLTHRQFTLPCESCGRRLLWWSWAKSSTSPSGGAIDDRYFEEPRLQWQGQRVPFRYRLTADGAVADVHCFHCGCERTYSLRKFYGAFK